MSSDMGKLLIISGLLLIIFGVLVLLAPHIPFLGRLPGDFHYRGRNFSIYFPLASCLLLSILLTILLNLFSKR
jgi:hypothetical protein